MTKEDFIVDSSKIEDFWKFINDRHAIYLKRKAGEPKPWSDDPIFQEWKFTNVFRELDRGTIALRRMLKTLYEEYTANKQYLLEGNKNTNDKREIQSRGIYLQGMEKNYIRNQFITCILYRMFNWHGNAKFGPIDNPTAWYKYLRNKEDNGDQIFGGAYILPSVKGEEKLVTFERVCREIVSDADLLIKYIRGNNKLEDTWVGLQEYDCIGPFIAYEFVCDLRYTDILRNATDTCTWCNIGPGAERGLQRMGINSTLTEIRLLYSQSEDFLGNVNWFKDSLYLERYPYWELREIEHCLCEFDKYERIRLGQGRPKAKFDGV